MKSYRDLDIYTESKRLAIEVHKISPRLELYEEGSQVRRSSKSGTPILSKDMEEGDIKLII